MRRISEKRTACLSAALTVALTATYILFLSNPHYDLNDDVILMRAFGGMVGGIVEGFGTCTHPFLAWLLQKGTLLWPQIAWFSIVQAALLTGSVWAIVHSAILCARRMGFSGLAGWAFGSAFVWAFLLPGLSGITFTVTAAVCTAASIWRLLCVDWRAPKESVILGTASSIGWMACAALLRREAAAPALLFWIGALLCARMLNGAPQRRTAVALAAITVMMLVLEGGWTVAKNRPENTDYACWQEARSAACDYGGLAAMDEEQLEEVGWTESLRDLTLDWCFLDERVTEEALWLAASASPNVGFSDALEMVGSVLHRYRLVLWSLSALGGLCLTAFVRALFSREKRMLNTLAPLLCGLLASALLMFLAWRGRLPMRAAQTVLLPANALAVWLALRVPAGERTEALWMRIAAGVLCAMLLMPNVREGIRFTYQPFAGTSDSAYTRLEHYALAHEDELFICDRAFGYDNALFPDWSAGKPRNLLLNWGGWNSHSEGYRAAFERFGYEHDHFQIMNFLDAPLRLVTRTDAEPSEALFNCMSEQAGYPVEAVLEAREDGFWIYRFQEMSDTAD